MIQFDCRFRYGRGPFDFKFKFESDARITAIAGPSGCGKTTLLNLVAGLLRPTAGMIQMNDQTFVDTRANIWQRPEGRRLGYLFQDNCLFPHKTVRQNIEYGYYRTAQKKLSLDPVLQTLELEPILDRYPGEISGGQAQRVALARGILTSPQLLLLDEPLTSVEPELKSRISEFIVRAIHEFEIPTLIVSHHAELITQLSAHVIRLERR